MTAALLTPRSSSRPVFHPAPDTATLHLTTTEGKELRRWVRWLGIPFVVSAAFFAAAIGSGHMWLMGFAWGLGPELMILAYIYLSLTSESNAELSPTSAAGTASDDGCAVTGRTASVAGSCQTSVSLPGTPNVICISHATGSGGEDIGKLIAARLGYRYVDDEIIVRAAEADHAYPEAVSQAESGHAKRQISVDFNRIEKTALLRRLITDAVIETAEEGAVVIVGHAASFVLGERSGVLRVRVTGSSPNRFVRLRDRFGVEPKSAQRWLRETDDDQATYLRHVFGVAGERPTDYDIVLNTDRLDTRQAATIVASVAA